MSTSPVLLDDTLYVYYVGRITALDVADGSKRWESDVNGGNNLLAAGGMLYVSSLNDLHAVDPGHGSRQWTVSTTASSGTKSTPAVVNGMIFFPSDGLYAYK